MMTQAVFNDPALADTARRFTLKDVVSIKKSDRQKKTAQPYSTGDIEIDATEITLLNNQSRCLLTRKEASDVLKLKYRYLDIRKSNIQQTLVIRSKASAAVHEYLDAGFVEIETPVL